MKYYCDENRRLVCTPYSVENLHAMAKDLGIKKCWFNGGKNSHYSVPKGKLKEVISLCEAVTSEEIFKIIKGRFK